MVGAGAYVCYNAFADTRNNRCFAGTAYQAVNVGTHGYACLYLQLNAVLGNSAYYRSFDNLGVNAHLHSLQHIASRKVNGTATLKAQLNLRSVGSNQSINNAVNVTACQIMRLQLVDIYVKTCLIRLNQRQHNLRRGHTAQAHTDEVEDAYINTGGNGGNPQSQRHKVKKNRYTGNSNDYCKATAENHTE